MRAVSFVGAALLCLFAYLPSALWAGQVRSIYTNDKNMQSIHLKMGQSTVLRFIDKPKKVVIGNQNYFNIEFIQNDVAIQPQGFVNTNLFIYTKYRTYGFQLKVSNRAKHDDLVSVRWRHKNQQRNRKNSSKRFSQRRNQRNLFSKESKNSKHGGFDMATTATESMSQESSMGNKVKIEIIRLLQLKKNGLYLMDVRIENTSLKKLKTASFRTSLHQKSRKVKNVIWVFDSDFIPSSESKICRLIFYIKKLTPLIIQVEYKGEYQKVKIPRRLL